MRRHPLPNAVCHPGANRRAFCFLTLERLNCRHWSVKYGHRATPLLCIAIDIRQFGSQQSVGLHSNLMRSSVIDVERSRTTANIHPERFPEERLLKNPLAKIACKEQAVRSICAQRGEKAQLRNAHILCLIDHDKVEGWIFAACQ